MSEIYPWKCSVENVNRTKRRRRCKTDFVSIKTFSPCKFLLNRMKRVISERKWERVTEEFQNGGSHKFIHSSKKKTQTNIYKQAAYCSFARAEWVWVCDLFLVFKKKRRSKQNWLKILTFNPFLKTHTQQQNWQHFYTDTETILQPHTPTENWNPS